MKDQKKWIIIGIICLIILYLPLSKKEVSRPYFTSQKELFLSGLISIDGFIIEGNSWVDSPLLLQFNYTPSFFIMNNGCSGEVKLAPNQDYILEVCLNNGTIDIPGSCNFYTSGEYGTNVSLSTNSTDFRVGNYRIKIHWKRIKDPENYYDHGEIKSSNVYSTCANTLSTLNGGCGSAYYWFRYTSYSDCKEDGLNMLEDRGTFTGGPQACAACSGTKLNNDINPTTFLKRRGPSRRIYEGYTRNGGTDATGNCVNYYTVGSYCTCGCTATTKYIMTTCFPGVEDSYPSNLCTYAGDNIEYTDYFTVNLINGSITTSLTQGKIFSNGIIKWVDT